MTHSDKIESIFEKLVKFLRKVLPDFGKDMAIDSKAIPSIANTKNKNEKKDGRRDTDADYGKKEYKGVKEDGSAWEKIIKWFGYKLHLIVDANYELPVAYSITKASEPDINEAHRMIEKLDKERPEILESCDTLEADRGYDDTKLLVKLYDNYGIKPVIDIRNMWKDGDETKLLMDIENVTYNFKGDVFCYCLETGVIREMASGGFEKDRLALKKLCPVKAYGIDCACREECSVKGAIRIPLELDRRVFLPIDRSSCKFKRYYDKRTSVERVNGRLDVSFGFENHYIRGKEKMKVRCGIALCVMLTMAVGRISQKKSDLMRSLVKTGDKSRKIG